MVISNRGGNYSISLIQGKSVSGDVTGGFLSTLSASLGGAVRGDHGLTFHFETPSDAAGFLAAIKQSNTKLALAYTQESPDTSKSTAVDGRASVGVDLLGGVEVGGVSFGNLVTAGGAIEFGHTATTIQGSDAGAKWTETTITSTRRYGTDVSAVGTSIDSRSMETSRSVIERSTGEPHAPGNTDARVVLAYSEQETVSFTSNGNQLSTSGKSLAEDRLSAIIDLSKVDALVAKNQRVAGVQLSDQSALLAFKSALQRFDPSSQTIVITESLKPDVLSRFDPSRDESRLDILKNPKNFIETIAIVSINIDTSERSIGVKGLTVGQSATGRSDLVNASITLGESVSINRLNMADSDGVIRATRSASSSAL